jgi:hypothetical protein
LRRPWRKPLGFFLKLTPQSVQGAINKGVDVKAQGEDGGTALMVAAAYNRNPEVIRVLVNADFIVCIYRQVSIIEDSEVSMPRPKRGIPIPLNLSADVERIREHFLTIIGRVDWEGGLGIDWAAIAVRVVGFDPARVRELANFFEQWHEALPGYVPQNKRLADLVTIPTLPRNRRAAFCPFEGVIWYLYIVCLYIL